jgi:hypothetical protein
MSITLGEVIQASRDRHPYFAKPRIPDAVFARYLTDFQRTLLSKATQRDSTFLMQSLSIAFNVSDENAVGTVGAGTIGSLPGAVSSNGTLSAAESPMGDALTIDTANAVQLVGPTVVTGATLTTISNSTSAWSTNAYQNDIVEIISGWGVGQVRNILSNTATALTVDDWDMTPDETSVFRIVTTVIAETDTMDVIASFPLTTERYGFMVRLSENGTPYLDLTTTLVAKVDASITLPAMKRLVGGTVHFSDGSFDTLSLVDYLNRARALGRFVAVTAGQTLTLQGSREHWSEVTSIELKYVPEPPGFTQLTDLFLLPDSVRPALVARCAYMAGTRLNGLPDIPKIDVQELARSADEAESVWLAEISGMKRSRVHRIHARSN